MLTFAIAIPNLNQSGFLRTALKSLRHQASPFELAVMDGGSSDNFPRAVQGFSDIISYTRSTPDNGQSAAIRESTEMISGDILTWLNADDYYFPNALDKVRAVFESNPDIDVVYGDAVHVDAAGFFQCYFPPVKDFDRHDLTHNCFICQPACFFRRRLYESIGGIDPNLKYTMDWDLWCRFAAQNATFHYLPEPLAAVRYYAGTKTLSGARERFQEIDRIEKRYGHRMFRRSILGAHYHGLSYKKNKTPWETVFYKIFDLLRKTKQKMHKQTLLYGFHRWDPIFEKTCHIHLPWYEDRCWTKLHVKIEPSASLFHIKLNQMELDPIHRSNGDITAVLPDINTPHRTIQIDCHDNNRCKLLGFTCDLG